MLEAAKPVRVAADIGFARPENVVPDGERPGLLRASTPEPEALDTSELAVHRCWAEDLASDGALTPHLTRHGFEDVNLPEVDGLRATLEAIRGRGAFAHGDAQRIRRLLPKRAMRLRDRSRLRIIWVADEGVLLRRAGPAGIALDGRTPSGEQDATVAAHADQDVLGSPLREMMRGVAPKVFRHDAPDSQNRRSPLLLVNIWMPLQQVTRPLTLLDSTTFDRRSHQLRFGELTDGILDRDAGKNVNDIWSVLPDDAQRWYFRSDLGLGDAYVFDTLSTPHSAFVLPGEQIAADRYRRLGELLAAVAGARTAEDVREVRRDWPVGLATEDIATPTLRRAIEQMDAALDAVAQDVHRVVADSGWRRAWCERAEAARNAVVRISVEVRAVAVRIPAPPRIGRMAST